MAAADEAIGAVDQVALAQFVAQKSPEEGPGAAKNKKEMGEMKEGLIDAMHKKCQALLQKLLHKRAVRAQQATPLTCLLADATVLCCAVLCCAALCCAVLCCAVRWCRAVLCCTVPCCARPVDLSSTLHLL